jgi:hypothetical protein
LESIARMRPAKNIGSSVSSQSSSASLRRILF